MVILVFIIVSVKFELFSSREEKAMNFHLVQRKKVFLCSWKKQMFVNFIGGEEGKMNELFNSEEANSTAAWQKFHWLCLRIWEVVWWLLWWVDIVEDYTSQNGLLFDWYNTHLYIH